MKNKKVFTAAIWTSILLVVIFSFTGLRFTNNLIHAKHLEEEGKQEESLRLYEDVLASEVKSLADSLVVIRQSDLLGSQYREKWSSRFDSRLYLYGPQYRHHFLVTCQQLMQFLDYDSKMGKMDDEAVVSKHGNGLMPYGSIYSLHRRIAISRYATKMMASVQQKQSFAIQPLPYGSLGPPLFFDGYERSIRETGGILQYHSGQYNAHLSR